MNYPTLSENPLVSVMMPAKNAEKYLLTTIHSVQAQTHKNWELILSSMTAALTTRSRSLSRLPSRSRAAACITFSMAGVEWHATNV